MRVRKSLDCHRGPGRGLATFEKVSPDSVPRIEVTHIYEERCGVHQVGAIQTDSDQYLLDVGQHRPRLQYRIEPNGSIDCYRRSFDRVVCTSGTGP